jgi:hypothetical protein
MKPLNLSEEQQEAVMEILTPQFDKATDPAVCLCCMDTAIKIGLSFEYIERLQHKFKLRFPEFI